MPNLSNQSEESEPEDGPKLYVRISKGQKTAYEKARQKVRKTLSVWVRETLDAAVESMGIQIED